MFQWWLRTVVIIKNFHVSTSTMWHILITWPQNSGRSADQQSEHEKEIHRNRLVLTSIICHFSSHILSTFCDHETHCCMHLCDHNMNFWWNQNAFMAQFVVKINGILFRRLIIKITLHFDADTIDKIYEYHMTQKLKLIIDNLDGFSHFISSYRYQREKEKFNWQKSIEIVAKIKEHWKNIHSSIHYMDNSFCRQTHFSFISVVSGAQFNHLLGITGT